MLMMRLPDIWVNVLTVCCVASPIVNTHHWVQPLHLYVMRPQTQPELNVPTRECVLGCVCIYMCVHIYNSSLSWANVFFHCKIWAETRLLSWILLYRIESPNTFLWASFKYLYQADYLNSLCTFLPSKSTNLDPHLAKSRLSGNITSHGQWKYFC